MSPDSAPGWGAREEQLSFVLDAVRVGVWDWDVLTNRLDWSPSLEPLHGFTPGTFDGTFEMFLSAVDPFDRERVVGDIQATLAQGSDFQTEFRIRLPEGGVRWIAGRGRVFRDDLGTPVRMLGLGMDVTERRSLDESLRQEARRNAARAEVAQALAETDLEIEALLATVARSVAAAVGDGALLQLLSEDGQRLEPAAIHDPDPAMQAIWWEMASAHPVGIGEGIAGRVFSSGQPARIAMSSVDELRGRAKAEHLPYLAKLRLHSTLMVPLRARGRMLGVLGLARHTPGEPYTADDEAFLQDLADRAGLALEHARLYRAAQTQADRLRALAEERDEARRRAEELAVAIGADRDRLQQIINALPEGVVVADADGTVIASNAACRELLGTIPSRASRGGARSPAGIPIPPAELPLPRSLRGETVRGEQIVVEHRGRGEPVSLLVSSAPLHDATGAVRGAVAVLQDMAPVQDMEARKSAFLGAAAHDLRSPLTAIRGFAQLIRRTLRPGAPPEPERIDGLAARIEASTGAMMRVLDDLVDLTRLDLGQPLPLHHQPTDLVALAREVAAAASPSGPPVTVETTEDQLVGTWDEARLGRVLRNLVENGLKYGLDGGVRIVVGREDGAAVAEVADRGIGIPEADLPRVFERFQRGANASSRAEGTGVGLSSVKQIVEAHGGSVTIASTLGVGTTVRVRLPLQPPGASEA